jgi:hypothetical protein
VSTWIDRLIFAAAGLVVAWTVVVQIKQGGM